MTRPKTISWMAGISRLIIGSVSRTLRANCWMSAGSTVMKVAPYTDPATLPSPPTMIIAR